MIKAHTTDYLNCTVELNLMINPPWRNNIHVLMIFISHWIHR